MTSNDWLIRGIPKEQLGKERREAIQEVEKALKKQELRPCPFCGGEAQIVCCDYEGNIHGDGYAKRPYSGLGYEIRHALEKMARSRSGGRR